MSLHKMFVNIGGMSYKVQKLFYESSLKIIRSLGRGVKV